MSLSFRIEPRELTFKFAAGTSRGVYHTRRLFLVHLHDADNPAFCGVGECAPLYDLSPDYTSQYADHLQAISEAVARRGSLPANALRTVPSIRTGIEMAFLSAEAHARGMDVLFKSSFTQGQSPIAINGLIWMGDRATMRQRLQEKIDQGFMCIKFKIGAIDFADELALLREARALCHDEDIQLRVDANGAFTPAEAPSKLQQLQALGIHSIEQPIRAGHWQQMAHLCATSPIPIALDEELIGLYSREAKAAMLDTIRPAYLVLKPTLHGGFSGCEEWIALARERGIGYWVTSALESNVGLNAIAQWTAHLLHTESRQPSSTAHPTQTYQGLGTGQLFVDNIPCPQLQLQGDKLWYKP